MRCSWRIAARGFRERLRAAVTACLPTWRAQRRPSTGVCHSQNDSDPWIPTRFVNSAHRLSVSPVNDIDENHRRHNTDDATDLRPGPPPMSVCPRMRHPDPRIRKKVIPGRLAHGPRLIYRCISVSSDGDVVSIKIDEVCTLSLSFSS